MIAVQAGEGQEAVPEARQQLVLRACEAALHQAQLDPAAQSLTVVLADDATLRRLNAGFLGWDKPTDVLSFGTDEADRTGEMEGYLGDIVISWDRVTEQAQTAGHSPERELAILVAHGCLHLAGYDHADEDEAARMFALQEQAADEAIRAAG